MEIYTNSAGKRNVWKFLPTIDDFLQYFKIYRDFCGAKNHLSDLHIPALLEKAQVDGSYLVLFALPLVGLSVETVLQINTTSIK